MATKPSNMAAIRRVVFARKLEKLAYLPALEVQTAHARQHLDELKAKGTSNVKNVLLFYEHSPVFTIGIRNKSVDSNEKKRLEDEESLFHRLEESRLMLEQELGIDRFLRVYKFLQVHKPIWFVAS